MKNEAKIREDIYELDKIFVDSWVGKINIWFSVRNAVFRKMRLMQNDLSDVSNPCVKRSILDRVRFVYIAFRYSILWNRKRYKIAIFSSGVVNEPQGDFYFNKMYDMYCSATPDDIILIENSIGGKFRRPRTKQTVYHKESIDMISKILLPFVPILPKKKKLILKQIQTIIDRCEIDDHLFWNNIINSVLSLYKKHSIAKTLYCWILKKSQVKQVFLEDASYGKDPYIFSACRKLAIQTGEFQHGKIWKTSLAYNWHPAFYSSRKNRNLFPDTFITFGEHYKDKLELPSKLYSFGCPYLNQVVKTMRFQQKQPSKKTEKSIVFVSQWTLSSIFDEIIASFCDIVKQNQCNYSVILRPHPGETANLKERFPKTVKIENVLIEPYCPIYSLIARTDIVVGCYSTVLYEALAFGLKPYVLLHPISAAHIDSNLFYKFTDAVDLFDLINTDFKSEQQLTEASIESVWGRDSLTKWQSYVASI